MLKFPQFTLRIFVLQYKFIHGDKMNIIDAHAHVVQCIAGFTSRGELRAAGGGMARYADGQTFRMIPEGMGEYCVTPEALLKVMDGNGVQKAVLLQGQFFGFQNEYTYEAIKKYPDRFTGAASYDPYCNKVEDIKKHLFDELGFKAVKFEMSNGSGLMGYHRPIDLDGEIMNNEYKYAAEKGLTVVIDIGRPRNCCWQPQNLAKAIRKYRDVTFVLCHLLSPQRGDGELLKSALSLLCADNVYFDISALAHNQREEYPFPSAIEHLKIAKSVVGAEKLMFGSDMPGCLCAQSYKNIMDYIISGDVFRKGELAEIFCETADKVYFRR